jgi:hypothetical protein
VQSHCDVICETAAIEVERVGISCSRDNRYVPSQRFTVD